MKFLRGFFRIIPIIATAVLLGVAVWVSAVNSTDPNLEKAFPHSIPVCIQGQDPGLVLVGTIPESVRVTIKAPASIQSQLAADPSLIRATVNLSGYGPGSHSIEPQITVSVGPTKITKVTPAALEYELELMLSRNFDITYRQTGNLPVSYSAGDAYLETEKVEVSGQNL